MCRQGNPSASGPATFAVEMPADLLEAIAGRVAELISRDNADLPPYLTPTEAADYMRCKPQRIYDLTSQNRLPVCKDGSRSLYARADLDAYLSGDGPS